MLLRVLRAQSEQAQDTLLTDPQKQDKAAQGYCQTGLGASQAAPKPGSSLGWAQVGP